MPSLDIPLDCPPKHTDKTRLLETSYTLTASYSEIKLNKFIFLVLEGAMWAPGGEKSSVVNSASYRTNTPGKMYSQV